MTRLLLMIAYHYPPLGGVASLRALRFARLLPEYGWRTLVVTPARGEYLRDPSLNVSEPDTRRTHNLELSRAGRGILRLAPGQVDTFEHGTLFGSVRDVVRRWLYRPDAQIGWYPFALMAARHVLREQRVDALWSTAYPITAHLVGRRLQMETGVPWVADLRDLWTDWSPDTGLRQRLDVRLERELLSAADACTTVSPTYARVLAERGARRVEVLPNAFDEELFADPAPAPDPYTFAYLGLYYPRRQQHIVTALEAVARLHGAGHLPAPPRVLFIGDFPHGLVACLQQLGLAERAASTGFVAHAQAVRELRRARLLFLAGPASCETPALRGNIAGKVFEYLAARRPILMIGDPDSDVARLLGPFPHVRTVPAGQVDQAQRALVELLAERDGTPHVDAMEYGSRALTRRLAALLDSLC